MAKSRGLSGGYYPNAVETAGGAEGSGSSGRIDAEITASEDSSAPARKCISLNLERDTFGVPMQVFTLSNMSSTERKFLIRKLRLELDQTQIIQKRYELQRTNGVTVSSDILSCSNAQNAPQVETFRKSAVFSSGPGKKMNTPLSQKECGQNRGSTGRFKSVKQASAPNAANTILMKQCETLLKRLMSHQYGWVFNTPVDVVKLNIPDYFTVIKKPMDLGTIKNKIALSKYSTPLDFLADVRLTFTNAMTYNLPGNDYHFMADTLSKFFESRWKAIEKKLPGSNEKPPAKPGPHKVIETAKLMPPSKKRKIIPKDEVMPQPAEQIMTDEEKHNLGRELESLVGEMPMHIIDFLRDHSSNGRETGEDEIEIDIDDLSDDTLFTLRKLLDDYLVEKQKNLARAEPSEIEQLNVSGLSNSSMQPCKGNDPADEDVDIGGNEPPVSSYPPVEIEKDIGHRSRKCMNSDSDSSSSSDSESDDAKASSPLNASKIQETFDSGTEVDEKTSAADPLDGNLSVSGLDQLDQVSQQKPSSVESDSRQDGDNTPSERQVSPGKLYRAALLKNRFADTILKAREKTLPQGEKGDREKLRREREELEMQQRKEKARLQAEAKAAEVARRQVEAKAAAEARKKRELEREAARQALLQMEKTVEINENPQFLKDLEMLRAAPPDHLPSSADETSPDHSQDGLGSFKFGSSNPLEQLGLYMKMDEEEEDPEPAGVPDLGNEVEEGEID